MNGGFLNTVFSRAQKENLELEKEIDQIKWKSDMMEKKMEDMSTSSEMMSRVIHSTEEDISELEYVKYQVLL